MRYLLFFFVLVLTSCNALSNFPEHGLSADAVGDAGRSDMDTSDATSGADLDEGPDISPDSGDQCSFRVPDGPDRSLSMDFGGGLRAVVSSPEYVELVHIEHGDHMDLYVGWFDGMVPSFQRVHLRPGSASQPIQALTASQTVSTFDLAISRGQDNEVAFGIAGGNCNTTGRREIVHATASANSAPELTSREDVCSGGSDASLISFTGGFNHFTNTAAEQPLRVFWVEVGEELNVATDPLQIFDSENEVDDELYMDGESKAYGTSGRLAFLTARIRTNDTDVFSLRWWDTAGEPLESSNQFVLDEADTNLSTRLFDVTHLTDEFYVVGYADRIQNRTELRAYRHDSFEAELQQLVYQSATSDEFGVPFQVSLASFPGGIALVELFNSPGMDRIRLSPFDVEVVEGSIQTTARTPMTWTLANEKNTGLVHSGWRDGCDLVIAVARLFGPNEGLTGLEIELVRYEGYF